MLAVMVQDTKVREAVLSLYPTYIPAPALLPLLLCAKFHFFFQAEDGIRDKLVTGVQTCALPILKGSGEIGDCRLHAPTSPVGSAGRYVHGGHSAGHNLSKVRTYHLLVVSAILVAGAVMVAELGTPAQDYCPS